MRISGTEPSSVWEIGREIEATGQSRTPGRVMMTKYLPRETVQSIWKLF